MKRIVQIIPVDKWFSVYGDRDDTGNINKVSAIIRLIAFALVDQNGISSVEGVDTDPDGGVDDLAPESEDFLRYVHEHDSAFAELMHIYREGINGLS
jgi:hypothetical protein